MCWHWFNDDLPTLRLVGMGSWAKRGQFRCVSRQGMDEQDDVSKQILHDVVVNMARGEPPGALPCPAPSPNPVHNQLDITRQDTYIPRKETHGPVLCSIAQHRDGKVPSPRQATPFRSHIRMRERGTGPGGRSRAVGARSVAPGRLVGCEGP